LEPNCPEAEQGRTLPLPTGPIRATSSPGFTWREIFWSVGLVSVKAPLPFQSAVKFLTSRPISMEPESPTSFRASAGSQVRSSNLKNVWRHSSWTYYVCRTVYQKLHIYFNIVSSSLHLGVLRRPLIQLVLTHLVETRTSSQLGRCCTELELWRPGIKLLWDHFYDSDFNLAFTFSAVRVFPVNTKIRRVIKTMNWDAM
jgi:hypothetical protein